MIDVYFVPYIIKNESENEEYKCATVCNKEFWDEHKYLEDDIDEEMLDIFYELGLSDFADSEVMWDNEETTVEQVVDTMKEKGYNLLVNDHKFINEFIEIFKTDPRDTITN